MPSSIACAAAPNASWQMSFTIGAMGVAQIMQVARHASASAGDTAGADRIDEAATNDATTIGDTMPTIVDWDAMDVTHTTIN